MLGIHDILLWDAKNKIKSDWGLRCLRIHEIMNFTYIKLSTIYKYIHLKWEQCSLTIIECIYTRRQVHLNTTVPIVMHSSVWNDCLQKMLQSYRILSLSPSPELRLKHSFSWLLHCLPHSEEFATLLMPVWRKCYKDRSGSNRVVFSVLSNVITCQLKCDCWHAFTLYDKIYDTW